MAARSDGYVSVLRSSWHALDDKVRRYLIWATVIPFLAVVAMIAVMLLPGIVAYRDHVHPLAGCQPCGDVDRWVAGHFGLHRSGAVDCDSVWLGSYLLPSLHSDG